MTQILTLILSLLLNISSLMILDSIDKPHKLYIEVIKYVIAVVAVYNGVLLTLTLIAL